MNHVKSDYLYVRSHFFAIVLKTQSLPAILWYNPSSMRTQYPQLDHPLAGHLAALFTIFVWGITFINIKLLMGSFSPVEIMFFRLVISLLVLITLSRPRLSRTHPQPPPGGESKPETEQIEPRLLSRA